MPVRALVFDVFGTLVDWRSGVAGAFAASGVPGDPEHLADEWRARLWPSTREVNMRDRLEALRRTHVTAVLSNGHLALLVTLTRGADLRFDCLLSAELTRRYKPS